MCGPLSLCPAWHQEWQPHSQSPLHRTARCKASTDPRFGSETPWMCQPSQMTWQCSSYRGADKCRAFPAILTENSPRKELSVMPSSSPKVGGTGATDTSLFHRQHTGTRKTPALFQCSLHIVAPQIPLRAEPSNLSLQGASDICLQ